MALAALHFTPTSPHSASARGWLALLALATIATFANGLSAPFLLDDEISIIENESIHALTSLSSVLSPRRDVYTAGRPLLNLSFALDYAIGRLNPRGYHAVNILIHVAATLTLFGVVRRTLQCGRLAGAFGAHASRVAFAAALLWALHPLQTESVTYISQRAESLMGLCYLATFYCFLRSLEPGRSWWSAGAVACCCAGMLVKEVMVTAPLLLLLYDAVFVRGTLVGAWRAHWRVHVGCAATWLVLLGLMLTSRMELRGIGYTFSLNWHQYLRIEAVAILHYLRLVVAPVGLVFDYGEEISVPSFGTFVAAALPLSGAFVATVISLHRRSPWGFLGAWFFVILAPTSSFLPVAGQPIAENRMYLPLAALTTAVAVGTHAVLRQRSFGLCMGMAAGIAALTVVRNHDYRSNLNIWTDTLMKRPGSARAWCYHGIALANTGNLDAAIPSFQRAIQLRPNYSQAHTNLASALLKVQKVSESLQHFELAVQLKPDDPLARSNLGTALFHLGRKEDALRQFQEALRLRPSYSGARLNMGIVLAHLGRTGEALATFEDMVRTDPQNSAAREELRLLRASLSPSGRQ